MSAIRLHKDAGMAEFTAEARGGATGLMKSNCDSHDDHMTMTVPGQ